ncbi:MAG: efflux RND transporter periplasmic adaptor subunit [Nitrospirae bacterium]|nr:efflux RND transporter periplasmic adaptor subunit [Nitrospirota bacterium]
MTAFYKRFGFWILIILILSSGYFFYLKQFEALEVKGLIVSKQGLEVTVTATSTGIVKSDVEVNITAQRTGKIAKIYVEEGDRVKAGELIAELDTSEVEANLKKANADIKKAGVDLNNAGSEYKRKEALFKEGLVTQQQFDDAQKIFSIAEAGFELAKAAMEVAQLQYDYSFIRTPVTGVVSERRVDAGDTAAPGPVIASIVDPAKLYISAPVDEADVGSVALRQKVRITLDAYPGKIFYGKVIKISPIVIGVRQEARTFEIRVSTPEERIVLKPGMSADTEIITGEAKDVPVVPSQAIIEKGGEKIVYVIEQGRAARRKVTVGIYNWNFTEIKEGLKEGEKVIINPDKPGLKEGARVKVVD